MKMKLIQLNDWLIFYERRSWIAAPGLVALAHLGKSADELEGILSNFPFPVPWITDASGMFYWQSEFVAAIFGLEGVYCPGCWAVLEQRKLERDNRFCRRECSNRFKNEDHGTVRLKLEVDSKDALACLRIAMKHDGWPMGVATAAFGEGVQGRVKMEDDFRLHQDRSKLVPTKARIAPHEISLESQTSLRSPWRIAVGQNIRTARKAFGLSQGSLAKTMGVHESYIQSVECGGYDLTVKMLFDLAQALGCRASSLLEGVESKVIV